MNLGQSGVEEEFSVGGGAVIGVGRGVWGSAVAVGSVLKVEERGGVNVSGSRIGRKDDWAALVDRAVPRVWQVEHCLVNCLYTLTGSSCPEAVVVVVEGGGAAVC